MFYFFTQYRQYLRIHVGIKSSFCDKPNFQYVEYIKIQLPVNNAKKSVNTAQYICVEGLNEPNRQAG